MKGWRGKETVTHFPLTVKYSRGMRENLCLSALFYIPSGLTGKLQRFNFDLFILRFFTVIKSTKGIRAGQPWLKGPFTATKIIGGVGKVTLCSLNVDNKSREVNPPRHHSIPKLNIKFTTFVVYWFFSWAQTTLKRMFSFSLPFSPEKKNCFGELFSLHLTPFHSPHFFTCLWIF